jgi:uncharacterized protein YjbI with pentapeptide repeats
MSMIISTGGPGDPAEDATPDPNAPDPRNISAEEVEARGFALAPGTDLSEADLAFAQIGWRELRESNLTRTKLDNANLTKIVLAGSAMDDASFVEAELYAAHLQGVSAVGANFTRAQMIQIRLDEAKLMRATFVGANLEDAEFGDADCRGADFSEAYLAYTNFAGALLSGATFVGATIKDLQLSDDMAELDVVNLHQAIWASETPLPDNWIVNEAGAMRRPLDYILDRSSKTDIDPQLAQMLYSEHPELDEYDLDALLVSVGH